MRKLLNLFNWIDNNIINILVIGFIFIIPLYPKIPLKMINFTYIAIRLEDLYIAVTACIFIIQLLRKKIELNKKFLILFVLFWVAVFISFLDGYLIQKTVTFRHLGFLHSVRRIEYMIIFFIAASSIRSKKDFYLYLYLIFTVLLLVSIYGLGQKILGWPAIQTMNPEFSKGRILYLTPEARVSSTFAGHYDLAAYLVLLIPVILSSYLSRKNIMFFGLFILSLFMLILTASRISFIAYVVSITAFLIYLRRFKMLIFVILLTVMFSSLNTNLVSRFLKTVQIKQIFVNDKTGQVVIPEKITSKELPAGSFYLALRNQNIDSKTQDANRILADQRLLDDIRDVASKEGKVLTSSEEAALVATMSANLKPINTVVSDISFATRLQVEWPRAVKAFFKNPIFGTGPSSITEATDNDYLRWLGEFGLVGSLLFLYILFQIMKFVWESGKKLEKKEEMIYLGFLFGFGGLLINAGYIDVFEASKVAYNFWLLAGIFVASVNNQ